MSNPFTGEMEFGIYSNVEQCPVSMEENLELVKILWISLKKHIVIGKLFNPINSVMKQDMLNSNIFTYSFRFSFSFCLYMTVNCDIFQS